VNDLTARGHHVEMRSRYANGAAPVMIKVLPSFHYRSGRGPVYNRSAHAWVNLSLFDSPSSFDKEGLGRRLRALAEQRIFIGTSSWKYDGVA